MQPSLAPLSRRASRSQADPRNRRAALIVLWKKVDHSRLFQRAAAAAGVDPAKGTIYALEAYQHRAPNPCSRANAGDRRQSRHQRRNAGVHLRSIHRSRYLCARNGPLILLARHGRRNWAIFIRCGVMIGQPNWRSGALMHASARSAPMINDFELVEIYAEHERVERNVSFSNRRSGGALRYNCGQTVEVF